VHACVNHLIYNDEWVSNYQILQVLAWLKIKRNA
jgi:hypothetical protein